MYDLGLLPPAAIRLSNENPYSESLFRAVKYQLCWSSEPFKSLGEAHK